MECELTIIIPVYNVEDFICECVDSIVKIPNNYKYEVIAVDDGSTDSSLKILENYRKRYDNISIVHQDNSGLSKARNTGLKYANGKYILFLDSDDCLTSLALCTIKQIIDSGCDMGMFWGERFIGDKIVGIVRSSISPKGEKGIDYLNTLFKAKQTIVPYVWIYVYRKSFLNDRDIQFIDGQASSEDFEFNMQCISSANSIICVERIIYKYRIRTGSLSTSVSINTYLANLDCKARYYYTYPNSSMANLWAYNVIQLGKIRSRKDVRIAQEEIRKDSRIIQDVTKFHYRITLLIYRIFGYYLGSRISGLMQKIVRQFRNR